MAKIGFTKLGLKLNNEIQYIEFNEQTIEVKQYLPVEEKLKLITNVLELSHDSNNFSNPFKELDISVNSDAYYEGATINNHAIKVKQYIPIEEKIEIATNVLKNSFDEKNSFANPVKVSVYTTLEIIEKYTNVSFTEKQKENPTKLYDLLVGNGFAAAVIKAIPKPEYNEVLIGIKQTIKSVYEYQNSVLGILENISQDYSNVKFDVNEIQKQLAETEDLGLVKDIVTKLG